MCLRSAEFRENILEAERNALRIGLDVAAGDVKQRHHLAGRLRDGQLSAAQFECR
jgi:hypothetical protein